MPQRKAEAWPPFMLEILIGFRYHAELPTTWTGGVKDGELSFSAAKFINRLKRRGLIEPIIGPPYWRLTDKGDAAVDRILSASTAIADRIAPAPFVTPKMRLSYPLLKDPSVWQTTTPASGARFITGGFVAKGETVKFDRHKGVVYAYRDGSPYRYRALNDIPKGRAVCWNVATRQVREYRPEAIIGTKEWRDLHGTPWTPYGYPRWMNPVMEGRGGGNTLQGIGAPMAGDEEAGSMYIDGATSKVYVKKFAYGVGYWEPAASIVVNRKDLVSEPYESFMQRAFRLMAEPFVGSVKEYNAQMGFASGGVVKGPKPRTVNMTPQWDARYDRFKKLGTRLHSDGHLSRTQWKHVFDIVYSRTDRLRDVVLSRAIYRAMWKRRKLDPRRPDFESMRRIALETLR
jgi:hypothetical protein